MTTVKQFPKGTVRFNTRVQDQPLKVETDIQKRIQSVVLRDRIRIRQFFHDFDQLRKGTVGQAGFRSALATLNIHLSLSQITTLIDRYRVPTSGLINYRSFCDSIDEVFFDSEKAKNAEVKARSEGLFTQDERETLYETILAIKQTVKASRILLKPTFQDFDRTKSCHITSGQFARVLKQLNLLPPDEQIMTLLSRFYLDRNNQREVNYFRFCRDVDKPEFMFGDNYNQALPLRIISTPGENADRAQPQHFQVTKTAGLDVIQNRFLEQKVDISHDPSDIEKRLQGIVLMRRIRIDQFFHDSDKLRKGVVTESQFRRVLSMLKLEFTDAEFKELINKYRKGDPGYVDYASFCDLIDSIFTVKKLEKDPNKRVKMPEAQDTIAARKKNMQFSQEEKLGLQQVFEGYHRAVKERRVLLKPLFQDFDVPNIGLVTKSQFLRVLHQLGVAAPPRYEQLITKLFMDRGNADQVNYVQFCKDVDRPEDIFGVGQGFNQANSKPIAKNAARMVSSQILGNLPADLDDVIGRIRRIVKQDRIRLKQFLNDYDKLRSGNITITQFRQGLKIAKIELSDKEFQCLVNGYISSNKQNSVRYLQFCQDIDSVFTKPRLQKDPYIVVGQKDQEKRLTMTKYGVQAPNSQEKALANTVLQRFRAHLVRFRLQSKSFFQEWDRHNKYKVTPKQFRQVLASLGFSISEKQFAAVQKCFGALGTENDGGYIEYLRFLGDASQGLPDGTGSVTAVVGAMIMQSQPNTKPENRSSFSSSYGVTRKPITDLKLLMVELKRYIKVNRIRLREFFQDHDQLRKGKITTAKFRTVLNQQKVDLMDEEFRLLENSFRKSNLSGEQLVDYIEMDEQIEKVFTQKGIEKDPLFKVTNVNVPPFLDPDDVLNDAQEKVVHECLLRVGRFVKDHRLLLKPHFQDKDRAKGGFVANTRFRSILDFHKITLSDPEYELLSRRFRARATNEINYVDFDNILKHYSDDGWI